MISLIPRDGLARAVPLELARRSGLVCTMLGDDEEGEIPLPDVDAATLDVLLAILAATPAGLQVPKPLASKDLREAGVPGSCAAVMEAMQADVMVDVFAAASYLDVADVTELCAAYTASLIFGRTAREFAAIFAVPVDEEALRREELWRP